MDVSTDDVHDSEVLPRLLKDASMNRDVIEAFMDGAYDTRGSYTILRVMGIRPTLLIHFVLVVVGFILRPL
jgi:hypothetical protein